LGCFATKHLDNRPAGLGGQVGRLEDATSLPRGKVTDGRPELTREDAGVEGPRCRLWIGLTIPRAGIPLYLALVQYVDFEEAQEEAMMCHSRKGVKRESIMIHA
jgi:hypothetical protein